MRHLALAAAAFLMPAPLAAQTLCTMSGALPVAVFEAAKGAFLSGDFGTFADLTTTLSSNGREAFGGAIGQLGELFPDGFESCQTVVQRRDTGGMVQEVTTFNTASSIAPMSIYLLATPIRGELQISYVYFNTVMNDVMDRLR